VTVRSAWHYNAPAQNPGQTRQDSRLAPLETPVPIDAMTGRSGVLPGGTGLQLTGTAMTGTIGLGRAIIQGTPSQGAYPFVVTANETFTVANGHASLPRIDSVFAIIYDQLFDSSGLTAAAIVYVQGTAASTPTAPNAPGTTTCALRLWDIAVPAGASAGSPINWSTALTDRRTYTSAVGGITPDGATAGAWEGQYRDGGTATGLERYNKGAGAWESRLYLGTAGRVIIGSDTNLYRGGANQLKTDSAVVAPSYQATSMVSAYTASSTVVTTGSTAYGTLSTVVSTTVVVPPSGKVDVTGTITHYMNATTPYSYSDLAISGSVSGTLRTPTDAVAARVTGAGPDVTSSLSFIQTGAPGETLTITWQHRVTGGTAQYSFRSIKAVPMLG
jgi:hypothetical protein